MKDIPLCTYDVCKTLKKEKGIEGIEFPREMKFEAYLQVSDDIHEKIADDDTLARAIFGDVTKIYKESVAKIVDECKDVSGKCRALKRKDKSGKDRLAKGLKETIEGILDEAGKEMSDAAEGHVKKLMQKNKDKSKYQTKAKVSIGMGVFGLTVGLLAFPTVGIGAIAFSLWQTAKTVKGLWEQYTVLYQNVDKAREDLDADLQTLKAAYSRNSKSLVGVKETGKSVVQVLGLNANSLSGFDENLKAYRTSIGKLEDANRELVKTLRTMMDEQLELQKQIDQLQAHAKKQGVNNPPELKEAEEQLEEMRKNANETVKRLMENNARITRNDTRADEIEAVFSSLEANKPGWSGLMEKAVKYGTDLTFAGQNFVAEMDFTGLGMDVAQIVVDFENERRADAKG